MLRYESFASMSRTMMLAVLLALVSAGHAYAQSACFPNGKATNLQAWLDLTSGCQISDSLGNTVTYTWSSYQCSSTPTGLCPAASAITVSQTASSCEADDGYNNSEVWTILWVQSPTQLYVNTENTNIAITVNGTVGITCASTGCPAPGNGTHSNWNWPHFHCDEYSGQTGYGTEDNSTFVDCGSNCVSDENDPPINLWGLSALPYNASDNPGPPNSPSIYCTDYGNSDIYTPMFNATFTGSSPTSPYDLTVKFGVKVPASQSGSAFVYSVGTHIEP
ncbi:MAG TPA: hypothetical protein VIX19_17805 [Terriglobales bacterium]